MSTMTIAIIIGVSIVGLIAVGMLFITISNKRKSKKLQEHLKKIKQEDKTKELEEQNISLSKTPQGENVSEEELFGSSGQQGFFASSKINPDAQDDYQRQPRQNKREEEELPRMPSRPTYREEQEMRKNRDQEFEDFLDEHAFSRKVFDKNLLNKIKKLPPEIKSVIMGNIFDKFNGDK